MINGDVKINETKQLKCSPKRKGGEESQDLENFVTTDAASFGRNWTCNGSRSWRS